MELKLEKLHTRKITSKKNKFRSRATGIKAKLSKYTNKKLEMKVWVKTFTDIMDHVRLDGILQDNCKFLNNIFYVDT